jgi:hypothetical protein
MKRTTTAMFTCRYGFGGGVVVFDASDPDEPVSAAPVLHAPGVLS